MINLTPIPTKIQERMKEKMSVLGRERQISPGERVDSNRLKLEDMMTRTTFIRMTSGQVNPVILMGGKLDDNGNMPAGYSEIYGPRSYSRAERDANDQLINTTKTFDNKLRRPMPGIKNIDVTFKGGLKTNREATISWTCWSWEEIDLLTPHFLAHGKTVLLEWGWVYDKTTLKNLQPFLIKDPKGGEGDIKIDANAFENYQSKVVEEDGNFDLMAGVIKNFEYTTREDGGFDCQTILTSVGINLIQREGGSEGSSETTDKSRVYDLDLRDEEKLREYFSNVEDVEDLDGKVVSINSTLSLKVFLSAIDNYVFETIFPVTDIKAKKRGATFGNQKISVEDFATISDEQKADRDESKTFILSEKDKAIVELSVPNFAQANLDAAGVIKNVWIRWGWFEDNILCKFLSLTSTDKDRPIHTKFRSIEKVLDVNLKEQNPSQYQSVRIRNNEALETVDINSYILPGQFFPAKSRKVKIAGEDVPIEGDAPTLIRLKNATDKFKPFSADEGVKGTTRFFGENREGTTPPAPGRYGFLRNMLINTKVIKSAFGANLTDGELQSTEPINILESIENMFRNINGAGGLNLWSFQLKEDEKDSSLIKIIDDATSYFDFNDVKQNRTEFDDNNKVVGDTGIFYFPVWQSDSIVKRQNITTKIPSAIQLATMYGANTNPIQEMENHATSFDATGVAAGGFNNANRDIQLENLNIAIKNANSFSIGLKSGDENEKLTLTGGEEVLSYILNNQIDTLEKIYTEIDDKVTEGIDKEADNAFKEELSKLFDDAKPIPSIDFLNDTELNELFNVTKNPIKSGVFVGADDKFQKDRKKILKAFASKFGAKFDKGKVRKKFLEFINERIIGFGSSSNEDIPLLIPFEIELEIDGIGGIYPANSFHSTYLPTKYQESVIFQAKDVNHRVDATGWTTTLVGVMRTTLNAVLERNDEYKKFKKDYFKNYQGKLKQSIQKLANERGQQLRSEQDAGNIVTKGFIKLGNWIYNIFNRPKIDKSGIE